MYGRSAVYYDAIYSRKNYEKESNKLHQFIERYKKATGNTLLDVACGTGNHLKYLKQWYDVEGLDINLTMLKQAKKKHPRITFHRGRVQLHSEETIRSYHMPVQRYRARQNQDEATKGSSENVSTPPAQRITGA